MIIKEKPLKSLRWLIILIEKFILSKFSKINILNPPQINHDVATLALMNHFSFTDGPMLHMICRKVFKKEFRCMSLESQFKSFPILRYAGCFSVNKNSKTVVESLNHAASLLSNPKHMLAIFPQGGVYSQHLDLIHFEKGLERISKKNKSKIQVIFVVALVDFLSDFKPKANVYFMDYLGENEPVKMEEAYNAFYKSCRQAQRKLHDPPLSVLT